MTPCPPTSTHYATRHLSRPRLDGISVERALVAQIQQLLLGILSANLGVGLVAHQLIALFVLVSVSPAQDSGHEHGRDADGQARAEPGWVLGCLGRDVNVAATDTSPITEGNQECHPHGTLRAGCEVVADKADDRYKWAIKAASHQEKKEVCDTREARVRDGEFGDEAHGGDGETCHDERRTLLDPVRPEGKDQSQDHGEDVHRDGHELGVGGRVPQTLDDRRDGCCEAVHTDRVGPEHDDGREDLPLLEGGLDVLELDAVTVGNAAVAGSGFECETVDDELLFLLGQESGCFRIVREDEVQHE